MILTSAFVIPYASLVVPEKESRKLKPGSGTAEILPARTTKPVMLIKTRVRSLTTDMPFANHREYLLEIITTAKVRILFLMEHAGLTRGSNSVSCDGNTFRLPFRGSFTSCTVQIGRQYYIDVNTRA